MLPDLLFKHNGTDIMSATLVFVGAMSGADKEVLSLLKVVGGGVIELLFAVVTEHQAGEHISLARCRSAVSLLSDFLHLIKDFQRNDRRMGVVENLAILHRVVPLLLVPNGVGVGFEIDRTACVLHILKNVSNRTFVPTVFILRCLMRCLSALTLFVCGGVKHLFLFEQCGDLARSLALARGWGYNKNRFCLQSSTVKYL